jgi:flavin reductase (DIM6/NTAB) family NADH-FMN oxidoreductase RutF
MSIDEQTYKDIMSRHPAGVTVVTTGEPVSRATGLTVSAFCTVSLDPPRLLVVIDKKSLTLLPLLENKVFTVNLLAVGAEDLAMHFASKEPDKFSSLPTDSYAGLATGPALVSHSTAYFECRSANEIEAGDHWIFLGAVERGKVLSDDEPLLYSHRRFRKIEPI